MRVEAMREQIAEAYEAVRDDPAWTESCRLIEAGRLPSEMFRALAVRPDILAAMRGLGETVYPGGLLERSLKERVIVAVSRWNECQYCEGSHAATMRRLGIAPNGGPATTRETTALAYTVAALADPKDIPEEIWAAVKGSFSDGEIVEITFVIGLTALLNRLNDCLGVRYNGEYEPAAG
jgi:AhpD family alkylhydroperoxidase